MGLLALMSVGKSMNQHSNNEQRKREIIKELLEKRSNFINIKAKIGRIVEPRLFQLQLENLANVRNLTIISGALATIGLLVFDKAMQIFSPAANLALQLSIILFLLTILIYSFYLKSNLGKGISSYKKKINDNVATAEKAETIINDCLDGKITKEDADKNLAEVYKEIEFERVRSKSGDSEDKEVIQRYLAVIGNIFFVSAIFALVFAFSYGLVCNFLINL